jgi:GT2 family glycosyltransferase
MLEVKVTIVVVPRERFSYTEESLESIYKNTHLPFKLIYVDGNSPRKINQYLGDKAKEKGFKLIRTEHYISPNQARNIGLSYVDTEYVVFIDNDVLVKAGWLEQLVKCADETGSWLVGPLTLQGSDFKTVHMAGGIIELQQKQGKKWMIQRRPYMRLPLAKVEDKLKRGSTELLEFHCMLVRCETFNHVGLLDEEFMSMCEEDDFCMAVTQSGGSIYFEPDSVVSYVPPSSYDLAWSDLPFFFIRWSTAWCQVSINRCRSKWHLTEDSPFIRHTDQFVENHRYLAYYPKPKNVFGYADFVRRRAVNLFFKRVMNWRASHFSKGQTPQFDAE